MIHHKDRKPRECWEGVLKHYWAHAIHECRHPFGFHYSFKKPSCHINLWFWKSYGLLWEMLNSMTHLQSLINQMENGSPDTLNALLLYVTLANFWSRNNN